MRDKLVDALIDVPPDRGSIPLASTIKSYFLILINFIGHIQARDLKLCKRAFEVKNNCGSLYFI